MMFDEARAMVAQTQSAERRAAAEQLLNEAVALPQLTPTEREAAFRRIRALESLAPDYHLSSFGASMLESVADSLIDPAVKKPIYAEAAELARWYASGASSGGEGTARSRHVREIDAKLQALEPTAHAAPAEPPAALPPPLALLKEASVPPVLPQRSSNQRPELLTGVGWVFIITGSLATSVSVISTLMILAGGDGTAGGSLIGGLIVIAGPPATVISGIGLLRRRRWAYGYAMVLLAVFAAYSVVQIIGGSRPSKAPRRLAE